jgi:hypothetical protein
MTRDASTMLDFNMNVFALLVIGSILCSASVQLPVPFIRFMLLLRDDIKYSSRAEAIKGIRSLSKSIDAM